MSIRLKGNGLWASSRMMLPEHKERNNRHNNELDLNKKPILDEQKQEEIGNMVVAAYEDGREITVIVFNPKLNVEVTGFIEKVDPHNQRIRIGEQWIGLADVLDCRNQH